MFTLVPWRTGKILPETSLKGTSGLTPNAAKVTPGLN